MTFLVLVATFIGCSCLLVPLVILAAFALFARDSQAPIVDAGGAQRAAERGG